MPHIDVRNLTVNFNGHSALKDVTVQVPDGAITAVIGPSGCGKTTFLRSLNRLTDMTERAKVSGEVLIDGENILAPRADVINLRKKLGLLSQRPQVLPMSIYDNVAYGPRLHGVRGRKELDRIVQVHLEMAGLWDEVKSRVRGPATGLSVGQQQRLCLARGLAVEPEVLLCDEPTASLDPVSAQHIEKQFQVLKEHYTIILVTHILRQARRLADYVIYMYMGELVEHGPAEEFFANPKDDRTKAYIGGVIS
jgi:phosphate transport system ATP-binding protein